MPVYMDHHYIEGTTRHAVADAHQKDLALQDKYKVKFLTYWFDEIRSTAFCLIEAPDRNTIERAHNEPHGSIPNEVLEVDPAVVDAFLGRIKDPRPADTLPQTGKIPIRPRFPRDHVYGSEGFDLDDQATPRRSICFMSTMR